MMQSKKVFLVFPSIRSYLEYRKLANMSQTMKALVVQPDHSVKIQEKPVPSDLKANEVLFKVLAVGQSALDFHDILFTRIYY
jgi:hypothetical protein